MFRGDPRTGQRGTGRERETPHQRHRNTLETVRCGENYKSTHQYQVLPVLSAGPPLTDKLQHGCGAPAWFAQTASPKPTLPHENRCTDQAAAAAAAALQQATPVKKKKYPLFTISSSAAVTVPPRTVESATESISGSQQRARRAFYCPTVPMAVAP